LKGLRLLPCRPPTWSLLQNDCALEVGVRLKGKDVPGLKSLKFEGFEV